MDSIYDLEQVHGHSGFHRDLELWFGDEVAELLPESGGEVAGSRRVKRWGRVEQVEEHLLRGPGAEAAVEARLRRNPEALAALEAFAKSELVAVKV